MREIIAVFMGKITHQTSHMKVHNTIQCHSRRRAQQETCQYTGQMGDARLNKEYNIIHNIIYIRFTK